MISLSANIIRKYLAFIQHFLSMDLKCFTKAENMFLASFTEKKTPAGAGRDLPPASEFNSRAKNRSLVSQPQVQQSVPRSLLHTRQPELGKSPDYRNAEVYIFDTEKRV